MAQQGSPSDGVTEVLPLLGIVILRNGSQLGVTAHEVGQEDAQAAGNGTKHEVEVEIILRTNQSWWGGGPQDYSVSPSPLGPFGPFWDWNWVGLGWDWVWGDWGLGLDNNILHYKHITT